jgi:hypothetical protein
MIRTLVVVIIVVEIAEVIVVVTAEEILQEPVVTVLIHVKLNGVHIINHVQELDIQNIILP